MLFTRKVYPTIDPGPEKQLVERLHSAVFGDSNALEARAAILVALANATGLLAVHFDKRSLKQRKDRLQEIMQGDLVGGATREAIEAAQAACAVVIMAATVATTATTTH